MARKRREPENDDRKRGSNYAAEQIASSYFQDWVWDQMIEAERMRQRDPNSVLPIETKAHALKIARNMFQQLTWDTKREVSESKEFFEGFEEMLKSQEEWLAEMVLDFNREAREKTAPEAREAKRTPTVGQQGFNTRSEALAYSKHLIYSDADAVKLPDGSWAAVGFESNMSPHKGERFLYGPGDRALSWKLRGGRVTHANEACEAYGRRGRYPRRDSDAVKKYKRYEEEWKRLSAEYRAKTDPLKAGLVEIDGQDLRSRGLQVPPRDNEVLIASLNDPRKGNEPVALFYQYPGFGYGESFGFSSRYYVEPSLVPAGKAREARRGRRPIAPYYSKR